MNKITSIIWDSETTYYIENGEHIMETKIKDKPQTKKVISKEKYHKEVIALCNIFNNFTLA